MSCEERSRADWIAAPPRRVIYSGKDGNVGQSYSRPNVECGSGSLEVDDEEDVDEERLRFLVGGCSAGRESRKSMYSCSWNVHNSSVDTGSGSMILKSV